MINVIIIIIGKFTGVSFFFKLGLCKNAKNTGGITIIFYD